MQRRDLEHLKEIIKGRDAQLRSVTSKLEKCAALPTVQSPLQSPSQRRTKPSPSPRSLEHLERLSQPVQRREKVTSNGIAKSETDWIVYQAQQTPGAGAYDTDKAYQKVNAISGGKFNMSKRRVRSHSIHRFLYKFVHVAYFQRLRDIAHVFFLFIILYTAKAK